MGKTLGPHPGGCGGCGGCGAQLYDQQWEFMGLLQQSCHEIRVWLWEWPLLQGTIIEPWVFPGPQSEKQPQSLTNHNNSLVPQVPPRLLFPKSGLPEISRSFWCSAGGSPHLSWVQWSSAPWTAMCRDGSRTKLSWQSQAIERSVVKCSCCWFFLEKGFAIVADFQRVTGVNPRSTRIEWDVIECAVGPTMRMGLFSAILIRSCNHNPTKRFRSYRKPSLSP